MINDTINAAYDNVTTSKSQKKLTHYNLQAKISDLYLTNLKCITKLLAISTGNPKKRRQQFSKVARTFTNRHKQLLSLFSEQKDRCIRLINDYTDTATDIDIARQLKRQKTKKDDLPNDTTTNSTTTKHAPSRSDTPSDNNTSLKPQPAIHIGNHKHMKETIPTLRTAFKKIHSHLNSLQAQLDTTHKLIKDMNKADTMPQRVKLLQTQIQPRYHTIKTKINDTLTVHNSAHINYNASFGQPKDLAKSIHQKVDPPLRANTHIPLSQGHHRAPKMIPAIGATERLEATKATQQLQMAAPPGKALHFVTIKTDDVGPAGINVDLSKQFTHSDLTTYHPAADELNAETKTSIIDAHNRFKQYITPLQIDTDNKQPYKWPFNFVMDPKTHRAKFQGPLQNLEQTARPTPSKARLNSFTINVLARMPRCWLQHTTSIIQLILATRIIPTDLKTCGRILIDKPATTDKRPISILHAIDAILDSTVGASLSQTLETIDIFDDSILAYRKGRCSTDAVLNHLITVQDIAAQQQPQSDRKILAQFDLDQEKFFDRLTTELQLLPFHIAGFPDQGYIEWLAESLSGIIIITTTPFGKVECFFKCGTRQGATLSTITANMVGWLISIPWRTPHPDLHKTTPGHVLTAKNGTPIHDELALTHDQQTFCDDASKYIVTSIKDIYKYIDHILEITSTMSIVTKLSINADKSSVRITGLDPNPIPHRPSLTVWHHNTKSVKTTFIRTINMSSQPDSYLYKMFGVLINKHGTPAKKHHTTLPQVRALTQSWKIGTISDRALVNHYPLYVTSICNFAALAKGFSIFSCREIDHNTITSLLLHHFHMHPSIDPIHNIILPTKMAGFHFTGFLTTTVIDAYCRELLVHSNNPFPDTTNTVTARFTQAIHNCYHSTSHVEDHLCPNALYQIALAGFYLRPTNMPIANATITIAAKQHPSHIPFGWTPPVHYNDQNPLDRALTKSNALFSTHSTMYQDCVRLIRVAAAKTPTQANLVPQYHHFLNEAQNYPASFSDPTTHKPSYHILPAITKAVHSLIQQHQTLLQFFSPHSILTIYDHNPPPFTTYLKESPLPIDSLEKHLFHWQPLDTNTDDINAFFRQATETIRTPDPNAYQEYPRSTHIQLMHTAMHHAVTELDSPIILSGDSSNSSASPIITSATFLIAIDFKTNQTPDWQNDTPIPLYYRAHILPPRVGTMPTNNNMGEIHAATTALNTAPFDHPIIIILDSHITLQAIFQFFFPTSHSNREHIRSTFPSNNIYYISELHEALDKHWRNSKSLEHIVHQHPHLKTATANFQQITDMLATAYGAKACLDIKHWQQHHHGRPPAWSKTTKLLQYDNLLFVHVKSHQLTPNGEPKQKQTPNGNTVQIKVLPNRLFALMNAYADNICSRITKDPANYSALPIPIPLPPITRLQNVIYHNGSIVTQPINNYIDTTLYNHAMSRAQLHPLGWHLDILPTLHDPTSSIPNSDIRKEIITTRAISHHRLLLTNETYKSQWNDTPDSPDSPQHTCPFCIAPNTSTPDQFHHHYTCTHPTILQTRNESLTNIRTAASLIQSLLHALYFLIKPHRHDAHTQTILHLLLGALTSTNENNTYTPDDKSEQRQTGQLPERFQPTTATRQRYPTINAIYTTPPSPTQKSSFNTTNTIPLTGLLPHTTHEIIRQYTSELIALTHHLFPTHKHHANEIEQINNSIPEAWHIPTAPKTITLAFNQAWSQFFTAIHQHPVRMQKVITKTILETRDTLLPRPPKPKRKNKKRKRQHNPQPSQPAKRPTTPCQGIRCKIRHEHGLPPTPSKTLTCPDCVTYNAALDAAGKCTKLLQEDTTTLAQSLRTMLPVFDIIDPTTTTIDEIATQLTITTTSLRDLSAALHPQLHSDITNAIHTDLNILPYQPEDEPPLDLNPITTTTLHFIAVTLLLHLQPDSPSEFPPLNTPGAANVLTQATTTCRCRPYTHSTAMQNDMANTPTICKTCKHLRQQFPIPDLSSNLTRPQCITCGTDSDTYHYTDKPCMECMLAALLQQNKPPTWHRQHTNDLTNTIPSYYT